jgi:hypothetical protein
VIKDASQDIAAPTSASPPVNQAISHAAHHTPIEGVQDQVLRKVQIPQEEKKEIRK